VSEISLQRELSRNDSGHAVVKRPSSLYEIRKEIDLALSGHPAMFMKKIEAVWPDTDVVLNTNPLMVVKVLVNMLVNALEATARGDRATLRTAIEDSAIIWEVWNNAYIPVEIQKRVFQRHFSTKARIGRGLGTYSMKLFGEQYLQGKVTFQSLPESGTTFTFRLPRL
jgi:signal transduction histidine kinase